MRRLLLTLGLLPVLSGCPWIGPTLESERLDPDTDGVPWPEDCDSKDPEVGAATTFHADTDSDGYGDPEVSEKACEPPEGFVDNADDCDDADAAIGLPRLFERDEDRDGYGVADETTEDCFPPDDTWVVAGGPPDCNDAEAVQNPGLPEVCNDGLDNDCDGTPNDCLISGEQSLNDPLPAGGRAYRGTDWSELGSAGAVGDATGDGVPDLVVGAPFYGDAGSQYGAAFVIPGPLSDGPELPAHEEAVYVLDGTTDSLGSGREVAIVGDTNGTGPTVVVAAPYGSGAYGSGYPGGAVHVYADVTAGLPTTTIYSAGDYQNLGDGLVALGDVNADGAMDFAYAVGNDPDAGVFLIRGPVDSGNFVHGTYPAATTFTQITWETRVGRAMAVGDTDGDGVPELYLGDPNRNGGTVWQADPTLLGHWWLDNLPNVSLPGWDGLDNYTWFGHQLAVVGDVTGDGYDDLAVSVPGYDDPNNGDNVGAVYLYAGGPGGALADPAPQLVVGEILYGSMGNGLSAAGDVDSDGHVDVLVTSTAGYYLPGQGADARVLFGGPVGTFGDRQARFWGMDTWMSRPFTAGGVDLNGDGVGDLVVSEVNQEQYGNGVTTVIFGLGY